jgi:hypothetical protein
LLFVLQLCCAIYISFDPLSLHYALPILLHTGAKGVVNPGQQKARGFWPFWVWTNAPVVAAQRRATVGYLTSLTPDPCTFVVVSEFYFNSIGRPVSIECCEFVLAFAKYKSGLYLFSQKKKKKNAVHLQPTVLI